MCDQRRRLSVAQVMDLGTVALAPARLEAWDLVVLIPQVVKRRP
jgi:hypothetical protein